MMLAPVTDGQRSLNMMPHARCNKSESIIPSEFKEMMLFPAVINTFNVISMCPGDRIFVKLVVIDRHVAVVIVVSG
jgi:hypothetical protein